MKYLVSQGVEVIEPNAFKAEENATIHLPKSVKEIANDAFTAVNPDIVIEVFYEGTMEEWKKVKKGLIRIRYVEDWYGYYYHNTDRYEEIQDYFSWITNCKTPVMIHCADGDIKQSNSDDRRKPIRTES